MTDPKAKICPQCGGWLFRYTFGSMPVAFKCFKCGYRIEPPTGDLRPGLAEILVLKGKHMASSATSSPSVTKETISNASVGKATVSNDSVSENLPDPGEGSVLIFMSLPSATQE